MAPVYGSSRIGRSSSRGLTTSRPCPRAQLTRPRRRSAANHRKSAPSTLGSRGSPSSDPVSKGAMCPPVLPQRCRMSRVRRGALTALVRHVWWLGHVPPIHT
ncbi:hypothetical protein NDU88_002683 [Pleurodeles waltl]|uniref:Uncharacterized protein n=1 Tax=Pleurodeles waltl TaxID=8319 RepID=A0AAV7VB89_PLEWA|nr:hypothetical protein NDU88_002683 [Pleurodeles waltl]